LLCRDEESYSQTAEILRSKATAWTEQAEARKIEDEIIVAKQQQEPEEWMRKFRL
jgi:hypothetical protein